MKILSAFALLSAVVFAGETKIALKDLPAPVQKAVAAEQGKGATVRGFTKEVENGKTEYEAELSVNGHAKDIAYDAAGTVLSVEEEVAIDAIPAPARAAIEKAAAGGKVNKVETVTEGGKSFFEASIRKGTKNSEVQVDASGAKIK